MFRGDRHRTQAHKRPVYPLPSTSLQPSSLPPSGSTMLQSATPDIVTSDHPVASPLSTPTKKKFSSATATAVSPAPRSSSLGAMGQTPSQIPVPATPVASSFSSPSPASHSKGFNIKRAFGVRRNKTEDVNPISLSLHKTRSRVTDDASVVSSAHSRRPLGAKQLSLQLASAFSPKQTPPTAVSPAFGQLPPPPPPPPKNVALQAGKNVILGESAADLRGSILTLSPTPAAAMQHDEPVPEKEAPRVHSTEGAKRDKEKAETKEVWRKSDSNMSFNTIRQGAGTVGNRTSRPVSMAESLHSTHTIVPVNKRLSALVTEAEFAMAEEEDGDKAQSIAFASLSPVTVGKTSPSGSLKSRNRRSASLNLPLPFAKRGSPPLNTMTAEYLARSSADNPRLPISSAKDLPTVTVAAVGAPASSSSSISLHSTISNSKSSLATRSTTSSPAHQERSLPDIPPQHLHPPRISPTPAPTFRQTAVSITSGFGPAAGLAKRAVEKMGRAWGGMHSASASGYSSASSTGTAPSTYSGHSVEDLGRPMPGFLAAHSIPIGKGKQRRTPNAPSGAWSMTSSTTSSSVSDSDAYSVPPGPFLGKCIRGPTRSGSESGGLAKGAVFGRDLRSCVAETALQANPSAEAGDASVGPMDEMNASESKVQKDADNKELEARRIPALVARCAQHILIWGVQEEGLFRVTGRPTHVAKIRAEFDTGADYDLSECNVGDLDPHAVSSVFKAYLRELPEPILTHALMPYFDAAMSAENQSRESLEAPHIARGMRGPTLQTGPKGDSGVTAMRKPPSLSTLAMPNFSGMRPPSESFVNALKSLVAALPQENRDLLRTVTDLINATAKQSKETKMPLSNLLLVFCPSLNMNPPLLRALCEAEEIWDASQSPSPDSHLMGVKRGAIGIDVSSGIFTTPDGVDATPTATSKITVGQGQPFPDGTTPLEPHTNSSMAEADLAATYGTRPLPRAPTGARRVPVATLYVDSDCDDDMSRQSFQTCASTFFPTSPPGMSLHDDVPMDSTNQLIASRSGSVSPAPLNPNSPPSLSSSTDSLATPSSISSSAPSASHLPLPDGQYNKLNVSSLPKSPVIVESSDRLWPSTPRRLNINHPIRREIQFPMAGSVPTTPVTRRLPPPPLALNGSTPHLNEPASSPSSLRTRRIKKPSLHNLFTRRSSASLHSAAISTASISSPTPYLQQPPSPMSSVSTPLSMFTAKSSSSSLPPMLDLPIESTSLELDVGMDNSKRNTIGAKPGSSQSNQTVTKTSNNDRFPSPLTAPGTPGPHETPIANLYSTPSSSDLSFDSSEYVQPAYPRPRPKSRPSQSSLASSTASYDHLSMVLPDEDEAGDDWAQSVLAAADVNGTWSVKSAMKFFGGGS